MNTSDLRFPPSSNAAAQHARIRWELFIHNDVQDVLLTLRRDTLRVVHHGPADHAGWTATLADAGIGADATQERLPA
ncbi:hypothetical protein [Conexibacter woesei]|uniref:Uncharacterized protein n=1 Tax=Conexibacter woesei (strain DSM 14684 / CCUG 47730 / CIP 108061 / JCM 11494 / NBRC 100937 / ID131577) TaxID=469383 RepID=D3F8L9_CONWI|nr:hypothetical protein [Conexibacter woesei]ADB50983.1 hypothetical protein Cwoe_2562 [Conexibacter woesei DSM 14684]